ncbi:MAG: hypothetical protein PWQ79_640 [Thermococcaceae archaeon]|nr:hypothetical protein [Thermococcaceae archaeon]
MGATTTILGNDRRMFLIEYLKERNGKSELRDVVEYIVEREGDPSRKHRKSVYVSLVQTHIPKLEREGIVKFERGVVTLLEVPDDVTVYMEVVKHHDIRWSTFYILTSLMFLVVGFYIKSGVLLITAGIYLLVGIVHHTRVRPFE